MSAVQKQESKANSHTNPPDIIAQIQISIGLKQGTQSSTNTNHSMARTSRDRIKTTPR